MSNRDPPKANQDSQELSQCASRFRIVASKCHFAIRLSYVCSRSIFAAIMKSLSASPSILCVHKVISAFPQESRMSG